MLAECPIIQCTPCPEGYGPELYPVPVYRTLRRHSLLEHIKVATQEPRWVWTHRAIALVAETD